jgi:hypothetical protein
MVKGCIEGVIQKSKLLITVSLSNLLKQTF